jgi:2-polyprenyl-3-methyl-5-hydroxy-6-metoxy-1,4-benzoquinol methylase
LSARPSSSGRGVVTGNTYDKYGSANPVVRRLMANFHRELDALFSQAAPSSLLDVGCGEGIITAAWAREVEPGPVVGVDLEDPLLRREWEGRGAPGLEFRTMQAERLEFADGEFEMVSAIEVLEHVRDPWQALAEMSRCTSRWMLLSVPREPVWRAMNLARGAYWGSLGNTPGHLHHWSSRSFVSLLGQYGTVVAVRRPFPWTMALVRTDG